MAADLAAYRAGQEQLWGGIDELTLARYEAGVSPDEERVRVERALLDHPALRECLGIARELSEEWRMSDLPPIRQKPTQRHQSHPELPVAAVGELVSITLDFPGGLVNLPRRSSRTRAFRQLAFAAVMATVVVGALSFAIRSNWFQPGTKSSPEFVTKNPPSAKGPGTLVVDQGKGSGS